jgi:hypothetical protein
MSATLAKREIDDGSAASPPRRRTARHLVEHVLPARRQRVPAAIRRSASSPTPRRNVICRSSGPRLRPGAPDRVGSSQREHCKRRYVGIELSKPVRSPVCDVVTGAQHPIRDRL